MSNIKSLNFLPENLQSKEFFSKLCEVTDYILQQYHTKNIDVLKGMYDIKNSNFDSERMLSLLGADNFLEFDVTEEQLKTICILLSNLYEIKGTKRGLRYLLRLLNLDANVYEWYDINEQHAQGNPLFPEKVPNCSIILELVTGFPFGICDSFSKWAIPKQGTPDELILPPGKSFEDVEGKFRDFASHLLWICVLLHEIRWMISFTEYVTPVSQLTYSDEYIFYSKYSPYVTNCGMGSLQVGFPVFNIFPLVGDSINVGDHQYQGVGFVVRSTAEYNQPINYDGWENVGFVGYSEEEISVPEVNETGVIVGQNFYWNPLLSYPVWYKVGERRTTGTVSPGTPIVSGCAPSKIDVYKEIDFSAHYAIKHGIIVDPERVVGAGYNVGEEHGDVLTPAFDTYYENYTETLDATSLEKETALASNIADLYTPFLVGDADKFVGDPNLRVGQDYFLTDFQSEKLVDMEEVFYVSCRQVNSFGNLIIGDMTLPPDIETPLVVGTENTTGTFNFTVGQTKFDLDPSIFLHPITGRVGLPLEVGTSYIVGGGQYIGTYNVGQGFNFVGDCAPWDQTNIARNQNIIYEILCNTTETNLISDGLLSVDNLESTSEETALASYVFPQNIGNPGNLVGTLDLNCFEGASHLEDSETVGFENGVLIEFPIVGENTRTSSTIVVGEQAEAGSGILVGENIHAGETIIGFDQFGKPSTGVELNIRTSFKDSLQDVQFEEIQNVAETFESTSEEIALASYVFPQNIGNPGNLVGTLDLNCFEGASHLEDSETVGFENGVLIEFPIVGENTRTASTIVVGDQTETGSGILVGENVHAGEVIIGYDQFGKPSTGTEINIRTSFKDPLQDVQFEEIQNVAETFETTPTEFQSSERFYINYFQYFVGEGWLVGSFNVGENDSPEIVGSEEGDVLIYPVNDGINPVYMVGENFQPFSYDPLFNPFNIIHSTITYTIEED